MGGGGLLHQNEEVTQDKVGSRIQEIEDPTEKNNEGITKIRGEKPQTKAVEQTYRSPNPVQKVLGEISWRKGNE